MRLHRLSGLLCCALLVAALGCRKEGEHSPAYAEAQDEFNQLYGRHVEDSYLMPEMAPIEQKLASVPEASSDYARAQELLKRIRSGRERVEAENEARREAVEAALKPSGESSRFAEEAPPEPPAAKGPPDAGPPQHPEVGMAAADIQKQWGDCFRPGESIEVVGSGMRQTLELFDSLYCRQHHPGFDQRVVILEEGKVLMVGNRQDIKTVKVDAGTAPAKTTGR